MARFILEYIKHGTPARAMGFAGPVRRQYQSPTQEARPDPLSLSSAYKRGQWLKISSPLPFSSPTLRWTPPPTCHRLATPLADLIPTLVWFLSPGFVITGQELRPPPCILRMTSAATGEPLFLCFPLLIRHGLMSASLPCSSGTELGSPSTT
jgi:hypothetical protein